MKAGESSFSEIMSGDKFYTIPFFQRRYVWNKDNWDDLIEEIRPRVDGEDPHCATSHFLGSVIFKTVSDGLFDTPEYAVIDGQQRLTTLCVLFKVCYDVCVEGLDEARREYYNEAFKKMYVMTHEGKKLKIRHSMIDEPSFRKVMSGEVTHEAPPSDRIETCYKHFMKRLKGDVKLANAIFESLHKHACMLVAIQLSPNENEQAIFDTINSAGVRLTSADIVKNAIFQHLIDLAKGDEMRIGAITRLYDECWTNVFDVDEESIDYWNEEQSQGRFNRTRIEMFLQCVAVIKGIYNPNEYSLSQLADCYKAHFAKLSAERAEELIREMADYAGVYRDCFGRVKAGAEYDYTDDCQRLIHILRVCETSTFDPLVLKMVKENAVEGDVAMSQTLKQQLHELECYVMRHVVCGASTKNFNKECAQILDGKKTVGEYLEEKKASGEISDPQVSLGLRTIRSNRVGTLVLFWQELYERAMNSMATVKKLGYSATLEHIMPRKWKENWSADKVPVVDPESGTTILDEKRQGELRAQAIQEIGNMTLLNGHLNTSVSNNSLKEKIDGIGKRPGVSKFNDYYCTKKLIQEDLNAPGGYKWNEQTIRRRTNELAKVFLKIWS